MARTINSFVSTVAPATSCSCYNDAFYGLALAMFGKIQALHVPVSTSDRLHSMSMSTRLLTDHQIFSCASWLTQWRFVFMLPNVTLRTWLSSYIRDGRDHNSAANRTSDCVLQILREDSGLFSPEFSCLRTTLVARPGHQIGSWTCPVAPAGGPGSRYILCNQFVIGTCRPRRPAPCYRRSASSS